MERPLMWTPDDTAPRPLWRSDRALTSAAGPFLAPGLGTTATHLAPGLGIPRAQPRIGQLSQKRLMHYRNVWFDGPHRIIQLGLFDHLALLVMHINDHVILRGRTGIPAATISAMG